VVGIAANYAFEIIRPSEVEGQYYPWRMGNED
jgi:hypothetical protein